MNQDKIDIILELIAHYETYLGEGVDRIASEYELDVVLNVLINVSAALLARALLMAKDKESKMDMCQFAAHAVALKLKEGEASADAFDLIEKIKGMGNTCQPRKNLG